MLEIKGFQCNDERDRHEGLSQYITKLLIRVYGMLTGGLELLQPTVICINISILLTTILWNVITHKFIIDKAIEAVLMLR